MLMGRLVHNVLKYTHSRLEERHAGKVAILTPPADDVQAQVLKLRGMPAIAIGYQLCCQYYSAIHGHVKTIPTETVFADLDENACLAAQRGMVVECSSCRLSMLCLCAPRCCLSLKAWMWRVDDRVGTPADGCWLHL